MQMRRTDREVTAPETIEAFLKSAMVCRIAFQDEAGLYIVPVNYCYEFLNGKLMLYFHGAKEGRKARALQAPISAAFEIDSGSELVPAETACRYSCRYFSVMGTGTADTVTDPAEKKRILTLLMRHQSGREFAFTDAMADSVAVFRMAADAHTAKQRL